MKETPEQAIAVLGIDAAWTETHPSGIALFLRSNAEGWRALAIAPCQEDFLSLAAGGPIDWSRPKITGSRLDVPRLLDACERLLPPGVSLRAIAVDMPISRQAIQGRRPSDRAINQSFSRLGCATHSPSPVRPGPLADELRETLSKFGFDVATSAPLQAARHVLEVYPHTALLDLLGAPYRVPYKAGKTSSYWPEKSVPQRIELLLAQWETILSALSQRIRSIELPLPRATSALSLSSLKRYEDALDALLCAWVGTLFIEGKAFPYGDFDSAIWSPPPPKESRAVT